MSMSLHPLYQSVVSWLVSSMVAVAPPAKFARGRTAPEAVETEDQAKARYAQLADAIATVAYDPQERPAFDGEFGRAKTAMVLLSVAFWESSFRKDVATGAARGDHGRSCTYFQFNIGKGKTTSGHTCDELLADPVMAARDALSMVRSSMSTCTAVSPMDRLSMYTSGTCRVGEGRAQIRYSSAMRWLHRSPAPERDNKILSIFNPTEGTTAE